VRSGVSKVSKTSSQLIINSLHDQLEQEKSEKLKIQSELEEMKKLNQEISSKLGLGST